MAKTPIVFLRDIPNDDKGQDFIATLKKLYNKDRYRILVRGQKPADKKDWVKHSFGIPVSKSKTLRLYIYDELKEENIRDLESKVWKLQDELTDLQKTVVEQRQKILELTSATADAVKTVEYHEYEIEVFCTDKYVSLDIPSKYSYKIWDCEYDRYVYQSGEFDSIDKAVADAKSVIEETREELYYG
jgi:uncharacterized coiled-coil protein SlyX